MRNDKFTNCNVLCKIPVILHCHIGLEILIPQSSMHGGGSRTQTQYEDDREKRTRKFEEKLDETAEIKTNRWRHSHHT